jgi:hypothetical protein
MLSVPRRRMLRVVHWISLPLALFCLGGPLWSLVTDYQRYVGKTPVQARVLSARVSSPRSHGSPANYEVEVRYPVDNHLFERRLEVTTYGLLKASDTVQIFVDRQTGNAVDDGRFGSWVVVGWGILGAIFFVLAGFRYSGNLLQEQHSARPSRR